MAPGLRLGWIQAKPTLFNKLKQSGLLLSGGGLNPFTSGIVQSVLELGLQHDHLERLRRVYGDRSEKMSAALREHLPAGADFSEPQGGFFIWMRLAEELDAKSFCIKARKQNLDFQPGIHFSSRQGLRNYLRLSFSYYEVKNLCAGIKRLARIFSSQLS